MIKSFSVTEGNLMIEKDTSDFGGPNMWNIYGRTTDGFWDRLTWADVYRAQRFFKTKLPVYKQVSKSKTKYELY
jgi:hypothetical protein